MMSKRVQRNRPPRRPAAPTIAAMENLRRPALMWPARRPHRLRATPSLVPFAAARRGQVVLRRLHLPRAVPPVRLKGTSGRIDPGDQSITRIGTPGEDVAADGAGSAEHDQDLRPSSSIATPIAVDAQVAEHGPGPRPPRRRARRKFRRCRGTLVKACGNESRPLARRPA